MIRRFISVLLVLMSAICFCGCDKESEEAPDIDSNIYPVTMQEIASSNSYERLGNYMYAKDNARFLKFYNSKDKTYLSLECKQINGFEFFGLDRYIVLGDTIWCDTIRFNIYRQYDYIVTSNSLEGGIKNGNLPEKYIGVYEKSMTPFKY